MSLNYHRRDLTVRGLSILCFFHVHDDGSEGTLSHLCVYATADLSQVPLAEDVDALTLDPAFAAEIDAELYRLERKAAKNARMRALDAALSEICLSQNIKVPA